MINISNYIQPYLPRFLLTNYYINQYIDISMIDIVYYYFNNSDLYDEKSITYKDIKNFISNFKSSYLTCDIYDVNDENLKNQSLEEIELIEVKYMIEKYKVELKNVEEIYDKYKQYYEYDGLKIYKNAHLSDNLGQKKFTRSCCNIKKFIKNKLFIKYIENKIKNKLNNKKIKEEDKCIIFILDIINKLFVDYINSLKYGINLLTNVPILIKNKDEYLPEIFKENFKIENNAIYIKHLKFINNINITNSNNEDLFNKEYIKIFIPSNSKRIDIYFE